MTPPLTYMATPAALSLFCLLIPHPGDVRHLSQDEAQLDACVFQRF